MSVYSGLLQMVLAEEGDDGRTVSELVSLALACRADLRGVGDPASRIGNALAYDAALIRLCDQLGVVHDLAGDVVGPAARRQAEMRLGERLPSLGDAMALDNGR